MGRTPNLGVEKPASREEFLEEKLQTDYDSFDAPHKGSISGLQLVWLSATGVRLKTGFASIPSAAADGSEPGRGVAVASDIDKTGLSLSASTMYHVYLYLDSGSPAIEVVTTAPAHYFGMAWQKTGDATRRYLGSVRTDGSGNIIKVVHDPMTNTMYYLADPGSSPLRALSAGTATSETDIDLSGLLPPTSPVVLATILNTADQAVLFGNSADASTNGLKRLSPGNTITQSDDVEMPVTGAQTVNYRMDAAVGAGGAYFDVSGYRFQR